MTEWRTLIHQRTLLLIRQMNSWTGGNASSDTDSKIYKLLTFTKEGLRNLFGVMVKKFNTEYFFPRRNIIHESHVFHVGPGKKAKCSSKPCMIYQNTIRSPQTRTDNADQQAIRGACSTSKPAGRYSWICLGGVVKTEK